MKFGERERFLISPFLVFFTIHCSQVGVGILSLPNRINEKVGHDGWISVALAGGVVHLLIWMIYKIFNDQEINMIDVNTRYFGQWIGTMLNIALLTYFFLFALIVLRTYVEIIKVWVFPLMGAWQFCLILLVMTYYTVSGGFRVVAGLCFWGVVIPISTIFPMLFFPLEYAHYRNLLPVFDHSVVEILKGAKGVTFEYLGFEMILIYYSFIKHPAHSHKWAQWANALTTFIYLVVVLIATVFYNEEQIRHVIWPTLTLAKIPEIPFIERMEYIVISIYVLVIFPIICLATWSVTYGLKRMFALKQKFTLPVIVSLLFIASVSLDKREHIQQLGTLVSTVGFYVLMGYIPTIYCITFFVRKLKSKGRVVRKEEV
ncbi:GerAB/ArcD/ProY family transporter [Anoxybacteroides amylolyticum]|uniref:Spore germination family protein n=1 Tax=Anoxybacteroides amylolyticum TaxID=294699 RepID=A0A167T133_9BACL|nr:GerAB/ArcD/ProY family transporter [Anoxybacillus amylolyticus]ANB59284.1 spore germination family protein [Anoxybacillus amylolyticus]